jgi:multimeric flavodoxin WrbA
MCGDIMRVLAINGSARMEKGHTHKLLTAFLEGMEGANAKIETIFAKRPVLVILIAGMKR